MGVAGGSYGGLMTNWVIGHTDRFKAAVSMRGISNWYDQLHDTGHMGEKDPWDNFEWVKEKSPITYVKNMKTPLLLIHSELDFIAPIEQAEKLFVALKKLRREVEFVRFPGDNHDLSRDGKLKHREERLQHIVRWFDIYLRED